MSQNPTLSSSSTNSLLGGSGAANADGSAGTGKPEGRSEVGLRGLGGGCRELDGDFDGDFACLGGTFGRPREKEVGAGG